MKRMKQKRKAGILILCFFLGVGIVVQARMTDGERLYVSRKNVADYQAQIEAEQAAIQDVKKLIRQEQQDLKLYSKEDGGKLRNALKEEFEMHKMTAGTCSVQGSGVAVTVDDGTEPAESRQEINDLLVHDNDILKIINELKAAGAEAISVNGERITAMTSVSCAGYTVRINGRTYGRPFVILAIGDSTRMTDRLIGVGGYGNQLKEWGVKFDIQSRSRIVIEGIDGEQEFYYMEEEKGDKAT